MGLVVKEKLSSIRNKVRRQAAYADLRRAERKERVATRRQAVKDAAKPGAAPRPAPKPAHTLETLRKPDATVPAVDDAEVLADEAVDEFSALLDGRQQPSVVVTNGERACSRTRLFCRQLAAAFGQHASFLHRRKSSLKSLIPRAVARGATALVVVNEDQKVVNGLLVCHLPDGPTALFRLTNVKVQKEIKIARGAGRAEPVPALVLANRFTTQLGRRVARLLASLFPYAGNMRRHWRSVTFHNQRDYVFFRHHRYQYRAPPAARQEPSDSSDDGDSDASEDGERRRRARPKPRRNNKLPPSQRHRVALTEIGPRFTLKLRALQSGTFDSTSGEYEWVFRRRQMDGDRRRCNL